MINIITSSISISPPCLRMSTAPVVSESAHTTPPPTLEYISYRDEHDLEALNELIEKDLSEPYSIFTYRYFLNKWPELCIMVITGY